MMIEKKIKRFLLSQPEINFFNKNESGSEYYKVGESIIRVSDHVAIKNNQPDVLNIIVTGENFVVMYGNRLINVNDYNGFKSFLKYHIQMCDCFKDLIHKGLGYKTNTKPYVPSVKTSPAKSKCSYTRTPNTLRVFGKIFDLSLLNDKQKNGIETQLQDGTLPTAKHVAKIIDSYCRQS